MQTKKSRKVPENQGDAIIEALKKTTGCGESDLEDLIPVVYDELKKLAHGYFRNESTTHTLQTTAIVHELYLKLAVGKALRGGTREQFFALAGKMMRHLIIDFGRKRRAGKRSANEIPVSEILEASQRQSLDLDTIITVDDAIRQLEEEDPRLAEMVVLRFYCGLTLAEIASELGIALITVRRGWASAKQWLAVKLSGD